MTAGEPTVPSTMLPPILLSHQTLKGARYGCAQGRKRILYSSLTSRKRAHLMEAKPGEKEDICNIKSVPTQFFLKKEKGALVIIYDGRKEESYDGHRKLWTWLGKQHTGVGT